MRHAVWFGLLLLTVVPAACSGADERPTPVRVGGSSAGRSFANAGQNEASAGDAAYGGASPSGGGSDAGVGNVANLGGLGPVNTGGSGVAVPAQCDAARAWGNPLPLTEVSTPGADETLLALTHDELTLVFSRDTALLVADRTSKTGEFSAPVAVSLPVGYTHQRGLGLSADGLRLLVVSDTGDALADVRRSERGAAFVGPVHLADYSAVNTNAYMVGAQLSSPVLAQSDDALYYVLLAGDESSVYRAPREGLFVPPPMPEGMASTLGGTGGHAKLIHSVSADERSIFFFDEAKGHPVGLWRTRDGAPFYDPVDFMDRENVFVNADCDSLYATHATAGSLDIFSETPE